MPALPHRSVFKTWVIADESITGTNFVAGANEPGFHLKTSTARAIYSRAGYRYRSGNDDDPAQLRAIAAHIARHRADIFKLGTKY